MSTETVLMAVLCSVNLVLAPSYGTPTASGPIPKVKIEISSAPLCFDLMTVDNLPHRLLA